MPSSAPLEVPEAAWAGLRKLRELSRLVLVAVERDDLERIRQLAEESGRLIEGLKPVLAHPARRPHELATALDDVARGHRRMVEALAERKSRAVADLSRLRATRGHLRSLRLHGSPPPDIDRQT